MELSKSMGAEQGGNYTGALGDFAPEMPPKKATENCHRLQYKSLFNVADLVKGMWKVAPENKILIFGLEQNTRKPPVINLEHMNKVHNVQFQH